MTKINLYSNEEMRVLEYIMSKSRADARRINHKYNVGDSHDECEYHTAYEWANAVVETIDTLKNQIKKLELIIPFLDCYTEAQERLKFAITKIESDIMYEENVLSEFWDKKPHNFEKNHNIEVSNKNMTMIKTPWGNPDMKTIKNYWRNGWTPDLESMEQCFEYTKKLHNGEVKK